MGVNFLLSNGCESWSLKWVWILISQAGVNLDLTDGCESWSLKRVWILVSQMGESWSLKRVWLLVSQMGVKFVLSNVCEYWSLKRVWILVSQMGVNFGLPNGCEFWSLKWLWILVSQMGVNFRLSNGCVFWPLKWVWILVSQLVNRIHFENRVRRIFGSTMEEVTRGLGKFYNEKLRNSYSSRNINSMIKIRRIRWAGHWLAWVIRQREVYVGLVHKGIRRVDVNCMHLVQDRKKLRAP
jgi:hypothetical protein